MFKREGAAATLLLIVFLIIGGCWPGEGKWPKPSLLTGDEAKPRAVGTLRLQGSEPLTLDPALSQDVSSWRYLVHIFSGLVSLDDNLEIVPEIARDYRLSPDGRVYTFELRRGSKFHDGTSVTAADFKYSLERALNPKTRSAVAQEYLGDVVGAKERLAGRAKEVSGIQVKDAYTLEITIDTPKTYFLSKLTYPTAYVVDKKNVESGPDWASHPNGTGPFQLKRWDKQAGIILLTRNDLYYGRKPTLNEVSFYYGGGSAMTMYERDELDACEVGAANIERVLDKSNPLNRDLRIVPQLDIMYLGMNVRMKPFDDLKVRQAFNYATDKKRIVNVLFKSTRIEAKGILPPGMPGYNKDLVGLDFDPEKAKRLITESSYGGVANLPEITLFTGVGGGALGRRFAEMYQRNLGVRINVEQIDRGFFEQLNAKKLQMFYLGWMADYPDPQDFLDILFRSDSGSNHSDYSNSKVDDILKRAGAEPDNEKRTRLYQEAEKIIINDAPWVPIAHDVSYILVKPWVKGLVWTPMGIISLKSVEIVKNVS
ncbi:MAG: peptide ABC transporter substrate-binding protein [Chloroflexi bacterium]|nr:peptide ABC transporter substrate-binding protein [Chloroflexota bacterium]MCL5075322.1 peptide ABC transporter substrate-binding protein [Chloroflexota bacterium]